MDTVGEAVLTVWLSSPVFDGEPEALGVSTCEGEGEATCVYDALVSDADMDRESVLVVLSSPDRLGDADFESERDDVAVVDCSLVALRVGDAVREPLCWVDAECDGLVGENVQELLTPFVDVLDGESDGESEAETDKSSRVGELDMLTVGDAAENDFSFVELGVDDALAALDAELDIENETFADDEPIDRVFEPLLDFSLVRESDDE